MKLTLLLLCSLWLSPAIAQFTVPTDLTCKNAEDRILLNQHHNRSDDYSQQRDFIIHGQDTDQMNIRTLRTGKEYSGIMRSGKRFRFLLPNSQGRKSYSFDMILYIDGVGTNLNCKVKNREKFSLFNRSSNEVNDSDRILPKAEDLTPRNQRSSRSATKQ